MFDTVEDQIRATVGYNPETGFFWWKVPPRGGKYANQPCGGFSDLGYLKIKIRGKKYLAHRIAWLLMTGSWPSKDIDHENGKPFDNRWVNLREATESQNMANRKIHKNNTSGVKGVYAYNGRWRVQVNHNGVRHFLGSFEDFDRAVAVRRDAASSIFGEFAREY